MMHKFDYRKQVLELYTPEVISLVQGIHEYKGKQSLFYNAKPEVVDDLKIYAKFNSVGSSNRIEGIETSYNRLKGIVADVTLPSSRAEEEIQGYKKALDLINESYEHIDIKPGVILQLHKILYKDTNLSFGGQFKVTDNFIQEVDSEGNASVKFMPVSAVATEDAVNQMCKSFVEAWDDFYIDKLLLCFMFILDFLCIHPFPDGNGRLSRLMTTLLLYKDNYMVGKYLSLEQIIEKSKETYYESLQNSSQGWHDTKNIYEYFVRYMLGVVLGAYKELESRVSKTYNPSFTKPLIIETVLLDSLGKVTKQELKEKCPGISDITIQRTLADLQKNGKIEKHGGGRYTYYVTKF